LIYCYSSCMKYQREGGEGEWIVTSQGRNSEGCSDTKVTFRDIGEYLEVMWELLKLGLGDMVFDFWTRWSVAFWKIWWKGRWACRYVGWGSGVKGFRRRMSLALLHNTGRREWANLQLKDMLSNCWWRAEDICVRERARNLSSVR